MVDVEVLTGDRVTLRAPTLDDAEELFARSRPTPKCRGTCRGHRIRCRRDPTRHHRGVQRREKNPRG